MISDREELEIPGPQLQSIYPRKGLSSLVLFDFETLNQEWFQSVSQVNYPNDYDFTRIVEIKHATGQVHSKTTIVREYPADEGDPFYPIPREQNQKLYEKYRAETDKLKNVFFIGRLAQYKYLNMDEVVAQALELFDTHLI